MKARNLKKRGDEDASRETLQVSTKTEFDKCLSREADIYNNQWKGWKLETPSSEEHVTCAMHALQSHLRPVMEHMA